MTDIVDSWNELYKLRKKIRQRYYSFRKIPVAKKASNIVIPLLKENTRILDIGAGNRGIGEKFKNSKKNIIYKSMDVDRSRFHDYYSLAEVKEKFDMVLLFEVIEHLEFNDGVEILRDIKNILLPGGVLVLTTPNTYHPNRYWEYSHKVSYRYDEIGGLLLAVGYKLEDIYRIYNNAFIQRMIRLYITSPIHYYFNIDFAESIAVVARI